MRLKNTLAPEIVGQLGGPFAGIIKGRIVEKIVGPNQLSLTDLIARGDHPRRPVKTGRLGLVKRHRHKRPGV